MAKTLPGPEKAGGRPRSKPAGSKGSRGRKAAAAADEEGDSAMPDAGGHWRAGLWAVGLCCMANLQKLVWPLGLRLRSLGNNNPPVWLTLPCTLLCCPLLSSEEEESVGGTPAPETAAARGSGGDPEEGARKRKAAGGGGKAQRRGGRGRPGAEADKEDEGEEDSQAEGSAGGAASDLAAGKHKKGAAGEGCLLGASCTG